MKYIEVKNCRHIDSASVMVDCDVLTDKFGWIPTTVDMESDNRAKLVVLVSNAEIAPYIEPEKTQQEKARDIQSAVQFMLDKKAMKKGYDNINSCGKYCGFDNVFRAECEAFCKWAADCWAKCYELFAQFEAGEIPEMTPAEVLVVMPECPIPV